MLLSLINKYYKLLDNFFSIIMKLINFTIKWLKITNYDKVFTFKNFYQNYLQKVIYENSKRKK